jgi:uncharacterized protein (DUF58 family)
VLFTSLDTAPLEAGLLPLLPSLTSRHTVLLAAVADPRVEQMAGGGGSVDAVYDAAAAERARSERRRLTTQLRQRGVEVVDAPPETFAPRGVRRLPVAQGRRPAVGRTFRHARPAPVDRPQPARPHRAAPSARAGSRR